jgi:hypothetical protein
MNESSTNKPFTIIQTFFLFPIFKYSRTSADILIFAPNFTSLRLDFLIGPYLRGPRHKLEPSHTPRASKWAKNGASRTDQIPNAEEKHPNYYSLYLLHRRRRSSSRDH